MKTTQETNSKKQNFVTLAFAHSREDECALFKQIEEFTSKNCINRSEWIKSLLRKELQRQAQSA